MPLDPSQEDDLPDMDEDFAVRDNPEASEDDEPAQERPGPSDDELSSLRIRQVSTLRRGAIRQRTYLLIGVVAALFGVVKLVLMIVEYIREYGRHIRPMGYALLASYLILVTGALWLMTYFLRRIVDVQREINTPIPLPPAEEHPDFSRLSDGTQHWKNLEELRDD